MNILVVGTGSIGTRHIKNILSLGHKVGIYSYRNKKVELAGFQNIIYESDLNKAIKNSLYDAVVIANKNTDHIPVAINAAKNNKHLYIEKPLSNSLEGIEELKNLSLLKNLKVETGYMMRMHPNIQAIKSFINSGRFGEIFNLSLSIGYWLPYWRPGTDYLKSYSAKKNEGGGVIFDLIHELDLLNYFLEDIDEVFAMTKNVGVLNIETESVAEVLIRTKKDIIARIHLNYTQPLYKREIEIVGDHGSIFWDYNKGKVEFYNKKLKKLEIIHSVDSDFKRNDMFIDYMKFFIKNLDNNKTISDLDNGEKSLKIALAVHKSALDKQLIKL